MNISEAYATAVALFEQGRLEDTERVCLAIFQAAPRHAPTFELMGSLRQQQGRHDDAEHCFRQALAIDPDHPEAVFNLGNLLMTLGRSAEALSYYQRSEELLPGRPMPASNLGVALTDVGRHTEALEAIRRALLIQPEYYFARNNLAMFMALTGKVAASIREAGDYPNAEMGLLLALNSLDELTPEQIFEEHRAWGRRASSLLATERLRPTPDRSPERVIRIGFVSGDFRDHAVATFLEPLLAHLDRRRFFVAAYADVRAPDAVTARLQACCDLWRPMYGAPDAAWASQVLADRIDILVDLGGHTAGARLRAFARRPAPVQVSWLGYPNTTGLPEMDWRLTDAIADPVGAADALHTERLYRLPTAWCFRPHAETPEVTARGDDPARPFVFGCFNVPRKFDDAQLRNWAQVLAAVPGSRLLLKAEPFGDQGVKGSTLDRLASAGIEPSRVDFASYLPTRAQHLAWYGRIDVALDTYPYGGTTTTCEALYMGVPVVTLAGRTHASRVGQSLLTRVGHPEWVAHDGPEFVRIAAGLASDHPTLERLRKGLRAEMQASRLMDEKGFARAMETALLSMWNDYCRSAG
jgi:predicted O-linked N-acetylglucosamine transferase (SPINDLY family)